MVNLETSEVLELLRMYRHDLMNDLQLIQGYASMGKYEVSNEKLNQFIHKLKNERRLQSLDAPNFVLWLIKLKLFSREFNVTFDVQFSDEQIKQFDIQMKEDGERLVQLLKEQIGQSFQSIPLHIKIKYAEGWNIIYDIENNLVQLNELQFNNFSQINKKQNHYEVVFIYK